MGLAILTLIIFAIYCFFMLVAFVFKAIGVYKIAKKENIKYRALSVIPIVSTCYVGYIADCFSARNCKKTYHKILGIVGAILRIVFFIALIIMILLAEYFEYDVIYILFYGAQTFFWLLMVASEIPFYIAMSNVYKNIVPNNEAIFLIISIFNLDWLMLFIAGIKCKEEKACFINNFEE